MRRGSFAVPVWLQWVLTVLYAQKTIPGQWQGVDEYSNKNKEYRFFVKKNLGLGQVHFIWACKAGIAFNFLPDQNLRAS